MSSINGYSTGGFLNNGIWNESLPANAQPCENPCDKKSILTDNNAGGNPIATHEDGDGTIVTIHETITTIVDNGDGTATYTQEDGTQVTFNLGGGSLVDNNNGTYTYTDSAGNTTTIVTCCTTTSTAGTTDFADPTTPTNSEVSTFAGGATDTFVYFGGTADEPAWVWYIDANGNVITHQSPNAASGVSSVTDVNNNTNVQTIATHSNGNGTTTNIEETITELEDEGDGTYTYTSEDGTETVIDTCIGNIAASSTDFADPDAPTDAEVSTLVGTNTNTYVTYGSYTWFVACDGTVIKLKEPMCETIIRNLGESPLEGLFSVSWTTGAFHVYSFNSGDWIDLSPFFSGAAAASAFNPATNTLYTISTSGTLTAIDVSDPQSPVTLYTAATGAPTMGGAGYNSCDNMIYSVRAVAGSYSVYQMDPVSGTTIVYGNIDNTVAGPNNGQSFTVCGDGNGSCVAYVTRVNPVTGNQALFSVDLTSPLPVLPTTLILDLGFPPSTTPGGTPISGMSCTPDGKLYMTLRNPNRVACVDPVAGTFTDNVTAIPQGAPGTLTYFTSGVANLGCWEEKTVICDGVVQSVTELTVNGNPINTPIGEVVLCEQAKSCC